MVDFVHFDTRAAAWPMARPAVPITPAVGVWPAAKVNGESAAKERSAPETQRPTSPTHGEPSQQDTPAQTDESATGLPSGPFTAQHLAQQSESEPVLRPLRTVATAAYLKTRDSHIQILRSSQTLDLRV